ncbi:Calcium uptake protein 1, mitochondrial [Hondaea fermentalgiana]|uniref:Calcium uptake protein 1, mitochondrial n=1 Tax=Hondaea fermentalgiana TaxID=2315210 RepID=A0A2R5GLW3_9STRA|nr:Calcium uptake protein 1, mitochondrial [Hondaea fermentalgiana]|eukprot:GBG30728.1 Calcium uptake protein 1, mitochondrial [Hondaea fermentalgiana]
MAAAVVAGSGTLALWQGRRADAQPTTVDDKARQAEANAMSRFASRTRLRRANTNLTSLDSVILGYEYRLRETASLEKIFKYFSSVVLDGEEYMTPLDLVRAISPGVPPSPNSRPINIPIFEKDNDKLEFTKDEMPDFFRFGDDDSGLISYPRFLVIVTLLALPAAEIPVAFGMCAGEDFKNVQLRGTGLNVHNFHFIMERNIKIRGQGYTTKHEPPSITHYLFGPDLKRTLTFEEFRDFHLELRDNVQHMQYFLLSDGLDGDGEATMSLKAFARSVAALVPSDYRSEIVERANSVAYTKVPREIAEQEIAAGRLPDTVDPDNVVGNQLRVSFEQFVIWQEVVRSLVQMEEAVRRYSYEDGHFSPTNINRAALAVTRAKLTKAQAWTLFHLFDKEGAKKLHHDQFVRLLLPHSMSTNPRFAAEGLGLSSLFECLNKECSKCVRNWYEGTTDSEEQT